MLYDLWVTTVLGKMKRADPAVIKALADALRPKRFSPEEIGTQGAWAVEQALPSRHGRRRNAGQDRPGCLIPPSRPLWSSARARIAMPRGESRWASARSRCHRWRRCSTTPTRKFAAVRRMCWVRSGRRRNRSCRGSFSSCGPSRALLQASAWELNRCRIRPSVRCLASVGRPSRNWPRCSKAATTPRAPGPQNQRRRTVLHSRWQSWRCHSEQGGDGRD